MVGKSPILSFMILSQLLQVSPIISDKIVMTSNESYGSF